MNQRMNLQQAAPIALIALLALIGLSVFLLNNPPSIDLTANIAGFASGASSTERFDYEQAAENMAYRWQAMARFYENHDMLSRDAFIYRQAAESTAYRWQAMARFYEEHNMLTRDDFDYEQAADNMAYRWQAMAQAYEKMGLTNER